MSRIAPLVTLLAVFAALFHSGPQQAWACSCDGRNASAATAQSVLEYHEVLAVGEVVSIVERSSSDDGGRDNLEARVRVARYLKGSGEREITVQTRGSSASCGYDLLKDRGSHFLALTPEGNGVYETSLCYSFPLSPMNTAQDAAGFFAEIESAAGPGVLPRPEDPNYGLISAFIAGSLGLLAVLVFASSRGRA